MILFSASLARLAAARIFLRISASSEDAPSAISSSPTMEEVIFSGCFDLFSYNKRTLIENLEKINNYSSLGDLFDDDKFSVLDIESAAQAASLCSLQGIDGLVVRSDAFHCVDARCILVTERYHTD